MATKREREKKQTRRTDARDWAKKQERGYEPTCVKLPEGVEFFKFDKVGTYKLDFLLYRVGKGNPRADVGMEHFEREYEAHRINTPEGTRLYCCRMRCFGKRCPVCDFLKEKGGTADPDLVKSLRTTTRHLWVVCDKPGDKKPTLKVLDTNHYNRGLGFGEQMAEVINTLDEDATPFELENGCTATLTVKEQTFPGGKFNCVMRIDLRPRKHDYPESLLDDAPCLDDCLVDPGYDALKKILDQEPFNEDEDKPHARNGRVDDDEDEDEDTEEPEDDDSDDENDSEDSEEEDEDDTESSTALEKGIVVGGKVEHRKYGTCTVTKISRDGTSLTIEDEDGELHTTVHPSFLEVVEEEDEDDPPRSARGAKKSTKADQKRASTDEDDDDDSDDDEDSDDDTEDSEEEEEEKPAPKRKGRK